MKKDISERQDIETLMALFYSRAIVDPVIGQKFDGIDLDQHLPVIVDFWETILFNTATYAGSPFDKHIGLHLNKNHFERWLSLFEHTVNELFSGKVAAEAIHRAQTIATIFQHKLNSTNT